MLIRSTRLFLLIALLCVGGSYVARQLSPSMLSSEEVAAVVSVRLQQQLDEMSREAVLIKDDSLGWSKVKHTFFIIDSSRVVKWNNNDFIPDLRLLRDDFSVRWIQTQRGDYVVTMEKRTDGTALIGLLPLVERYKISNNFLEPRWNSAIFPSGDIQIVDPLFLGSYPVTLQQGTILFRVHPSVAVVNDESENTMAWVLWCAGSVALVVALILYAFYYYQQGRSAFGFLVLAIGLLALRWLCIYFTIPGFFSTHDLFNPRYFASSALNPSLGDLLLNTTAVGGLCIYLLITYTEWHIVKRIYTVSDIAKKIIAGLCLTIGFFALLFPFLYFETVFHNSSISLDITQSIQFDLLRVVAFAGVAISFIAAFCFVHVFFRLFLSIVTPGWSFFLLYLTVAAGLLLLHAFLLDRNYWITVFCGSSYFVLLYLFGLTRTLKTISYRTFFYLLLTIFCFSIQSAFCIRRFMDEERIESQYRFANEFLIGRDFFGEFLLNETVAKIKEDPFIQTSMANPFLSKASVRQKVRQIHLNNYFDRYDVRIYLYNNAGEPLDSESLLDFASQVKTYQNQTSTTGYNGIYFTNDPQGNTDRRYLMIVSIEKTLMPAGFIVMEFSVKKLIPRNVYPELLVDNRFVGYLRNRDYSYATYANGRLISSFGEFNYERDFDPLQLTNRQLYGGGLTAHGYSHIGIEEEGQRTAVVSSPSYPDFNIVINLSFWIVIALMFVLLVLIVQGIYYWIKGERVNYSLRVQLYFYSSLLLPLLVVSITTLSITTRSAKQQLNSEYIEKSKLLGESLAPALVIEEDGRVTSSNELNKKIRDLARVSDADATLYDESGKLIGSSQQLIFDYQFKSEWIDHDVLRRIIDEKETSFVEQDQVGSLKYYSAFSAIRSPQSGALIGIVSLPFFSSAASLEKTQITILGNILSVFTAVLLLFSILSLLAADSLTYPLRIIARSLGRTTLTGHNEPLAWNSNDEIGVMVQEYNRMVQNLEQSKVELARTQKESAWREMAKQVAHEIKNPLTPMKLTLQQMEMLLKSEGGISRERADRSVKSLLAQVDILNEIASSFSTFARMPAPVMIRLELGTVLKKTADLYAINNYGKVEWLPCGVPVFVMGDEQLLMRIFSNLTLNALQSGDGDLPVVVKIQLQMTDTAALITIADNGRGISEDIKQKIFTPYFTTKKSGTGLGLAIVQQGIEQSRGAIWIESREGAGTTFFVQFPLA